MRGQRGHHGTRVRVGGGVSRPGRGVEDVRLMGVRVEAVEGVELRGRRGKSLWRV